MTSVIAFLPHTPKNPAAPTLAEIRAATVVLNGAFIDVTAAFKQAHDGVQRYAYETRKAFSIAFTMSRQERRRMRTRVARLNRRPALIHNGRKPR